MVRAGAPLICFDGTLCDAHSCRTALPAGFILYRDDGHLSVAGAQWLARTMDWPALIGAHAR